MNNEIHELEIDALDAASGGSIVAWAQSVVNYAETTAALNAEIEAAAIANMKAHTCRGSQQPC